MDKRGIKRPRRGCVCVVARWVISLLVLLAALAAILIISDRTDGKPAAEQRYYITQNYYYTNHDDYLQAVKEQEAARAAEEESEREAAEQIRQSIAEYNAKQQEEAETAFKESQKEQKTKKKASKIPKRYDNIPLLRNMVEAEAGNQDLMGKRLVACVALNRTDDTDWPDTLTGVITQPYQFSSYWDGGMKKYDQISDSTKKAVAMEIDERSYPGLFYFTAEGYSQYGTPYFKHGDHYFSTK